MIINDSMRKKEDENWSNQRDQWQLSSKDSDRRIQPWLPSETWRMLTAKPRLKTLPKDLDLVWDKLSGRLSLLKPRQKAVLEAAEVIAKRSDVLGRETDTQIKSRLEDTHTLFRLGRYERPDVHEALAVLRVIGHRATGLKAHLVQIAATLSLHQGWLAEMATGEGKSLVASLAAVMAGWHGRGCHVITVNDYLAERDAERFRSFFEACHLSVSSINGEMSPPERQQAYQADITYLTNKEVSADYLRDRLSLGRMRNLPQALIAKLAFGAGSGTDRLVMRGLDTAIIDEADSILIDEAVTPLIISGESPNEDMVHTYQEAASLAGEFHLNDDYKLDRRYREITLNSQAKLRLEEMVKDRKLHGVWAGKRRREELLNQALSAKELFLKDKDYIVEDGKVVIVDESTGRLMPDRSWRAGMHQAVEAKEGLEVSSAKETLARISFQRFFRLYRKLSGMTGTAWEERHELWQIYRLPSVVIPTNLTCLRKQWPDRYFGTIQEKWEALVEFVKEIHQSKRPILIGTRTVAESELLSDLLTQKSLEHEVLNASRHQEEADIVSRAGEKSRITIATNMAGRGTDIKLGKGVHELGGLFVVATTRQDSGRVDRQLFGRAGRQGDPGDAIVFISAQDDLMKSHGSKKNRQQVSQMTEASEEIQNNMKPKILAGKDVKKAQDRAQKLARKQRQSILRTDDWMEDFLGFAEAEH